MPYNIAPGSLHPNLVEPTNGFANQAQVSTLYDRPQEEFASVLKSHSVYTGFTAMLKMMGKSFSWTKRKIGHYEAPMEDDALYVGSFTGGAAAGDNAVITLHADSMYDTEASINGTAAQGSYPTRDMVVEFKNGVQALILSKDVSVTPHTITVRPLNSDVLSTAITAGEKYMITTTLMAEGSALPPTVLPRYIKWNNTFGITKEAWGGTVTEGANEVYQAVEGQNGASIYVALDARMLSRLEKKRDGLLLFGKQSTNIKEYNEMLKVDIPLRGTVGFANFAQAYGHQDTYALNNYTLPDLDDVINIFDSERVSGNAELISLDGNVIHADRQNAFTNTLTANMDVFVNKYLPDLKQYQAEQFDVDRSNAFAMSLGFYGFSKGGYSMIWKKLPAFSAKYGGAVNANYKYPKMSIIYPTSDVNVEGGGTRPMVGYAYKTGAKFGIPDRDVVFGSVEGVGSGAVKAAHAYDIIQKGLVSEIAGFWATANRIVVQTAV